VKVDRAGGQPAGLVTAVDRGKAVAGQPGQPDTIAYPLGIGKRGVAGFDIGGLAVVVDPDFLADLEHGNRPHRRQRHGSSMHCGCGGGCSSDANGQSLSERSQRVTILGPLGNEVVAPHMVPVHRSVT
jgi:hypothetical protein